MRYRVLLFLSCLFLQTGLYAEQLSTLSERSATFTENKGQFRDQNGNTNPSVLYMADLGGMKVQLYNNGFSYEMGRVKPQWVDTAAIPYRIMTVSDSGDTTVSRPGQAEAMKNLMYHYHRIDIRLEGFNPQAIITPELKETGGGRRMILEGSSKIAETGSFGQVRYHEIYPGIDMVCYAISSNGGFKYDFILHPGADLSLIRLNYFGADDLMLNNDGILEIKTRFGSLTESIPLCYAEDAAGIRTPIEGIHFQLSGNTLKFKGTAKQNRKMVIDPAVNLHWAVFFGGNNMDYCAASVIDGSGNTYFCGGTKSPDNIATNGSYQGSLLLPEDGYLTKYSPEGQLVWSTYLNNTPAVDLDITSNLVILTKNKIMKFNTDGDFLWQINSMPGLKAVDSDRQENIVVVGDTSEYFPTGELKCHIRDTVIKYNAGGILQWSYSYGDSNTFINDVGVDTAGNIYIAGLTMDDEGIGTSNSHLETYNGTHYIGTGWGYDEFYKDYQVKSGDGFFAKMTGTGQLVYGSYYGGYFYDEITRISVSDSGYFVIAGTTNSREGISTPGSFQDTLRPQGGYCFRIIAYGGYEWDCPEGYWQYIDTCIQDGPCFHPNPMYDNHSQSTDAFFARFRPDGTRQWGTYYGDTHSEFEAHVEMNPAGDTIIAGGITTGNGPVYKNYDTGEFTYYDPNLCSTYAYDSNSGNTYLAQFNATGQRRWGTYLPGWAELENNLGYWHLSDVNALNRKVIVSGTTGSSYFWGSESMNAFVFSLALSDLDTIYEADHSCECAGEATVLSVGVLTDPTADLGFQWMFKGLPVSGATDSVLIIQNTSPSDTGFYYCHITQGDFSWNSDSVNVGVREYPSFDIFSGSGQNPSLPDSRLVGDLDNDGDFDVIRQGYINYNDSLLFARVASIPALYDEVSLVDVLNDQDLFIFTHDPACSDYPTCTRPSKLIRVQNGHLDIRENDLLDQVSVWADFDNDGKVEGLKSTASALFLVEFENNILHQVPAGSSPYNIWAGCTQRMQAVDYDNDGDIDISFAGTSVSCSWLNSVYILENNAGIFQELQLPDLVQNRDGNLQWFDADADGDLDYLFSHSVLIDNLWYKILSVYTNDADFFTPTFTDTIRVDFQQDIPAPQIVDFDNDGLFDIIVKKTLFKKTDINYVILPSTYNIAHSGLTDCVRSYGDFDNDGDADILGENGLFTNEVCNINSPPSAPSGLSTIISNDTVTFSWQQATDPETPQPGLTYNLRVGTTPGGNEILSSMSDSTGWRKIAAMGNVYQSTEWWLKGFQPGTYYWSVQAIDNSYAGGPFAEEQTFSVYALSTTWTGAIDSLWNKPGNWSDGIPGENTTVIIPGEPVNQPILNISTSNKKIRLQPGSELIINSYKQLNLSDSLIIIQHSSTDSTKLIIRGNIDIIQE